MGGQSPSVCAWAEQVRIPTYRVGRPDPNPMFLEKRVYQGSSGAVYPHPVIDRVLDEKSDREYTALFLENRYLKVMVLPELGGRVQMALDKTNAHHFVYYNRVIKPALVGLCGPWISGGIEFNWPQHHRPSTFSPVDWTIADGPDGSRTVWCAEVERMFRTRGAHGFTLYPDRAYLEVQVRLFNGTGEPQTFLWWANPAVHVNDRYQSVFPPDVHAVMDHGKRAVSTFPVATGTYYKVNYAPGTDISRYSTIPVPTSFMAYHSDFDFLGCYDHGTRAGMLHVADRHLVPGKKQWTWGNGDFGRAWDRQLTDAGGPYIELMCGAFTDNQPDFSWIMPGEEKRLAQFFLPYKLIGPPKNAGRDAAVNLEVSGRKAFVGVYVTAPGDVRVVLSRRGRALLDRNLALDPESAFTETVVLPRAVPSPELTLEVFAGGRRLVAYTPPSGERPPVPEPAAAAPPPRDVASADELFLHGLHLEQYRHATYAPELYYAEALRRDPGDSRCNNALGLLLYRRGRFAEAESYFCRAVERLTRRNPNPYDGEPYYNLGLALRVQGRTAEAYDAFFKAVWNAAWQAPAYFELARLAARRGAPEEALAHLEQALGQNGRHHKARHLKAALLRRLGRTAEALRETAAAVERDPLDLGALRERQLLGAGSDFPRLGGASNFTEVALDYAHAGLYGEALDLLGEAPPTDLMVLYFAAWCADLAGDEARAREMLRQARGASPDYFFPNQLECVPALEAALRLEPRDWKAAYGLGNFWYAHRRYDEAVACWERARDLNPAFPTIHRNLGLALFNKRGDAAGALESYETAFRLGPADARVFFELDQLLKRLRRPPAERLARLEQHPELVEQRDDLTIERVTALNTLGCHDEALAVLLGRTFHPWEGGEGKVTGQYVQALIGQAVVSLRAGRPDKTAACLTRARGYPANLGEGKLHGARENDVFYWLGRAHAARGERGKARACWARAAAGPDEPASALYYNDQPPDLIFYQGLAHRMLGREKAARQVFRKLLDYGRRHLRDDVRVDYFAVSLPDFLVFEDDLGRRNRAHCRYLQALGHLGLGRAAAARKEFDAVLRLDPNHQGAITHRRLAAEFLTGPAARRGRRPAEG
jgi:tetratricopeptide (TPR) repeat protein